MLWDIWKIVESGKCYIIVCYQEDDSKENWMHTASQGKLSLRTWAETEGLSIKKTEQKRGRWVNFFVDGEVVRLILYLPKDKTGQSDSVRERKMEHSEPILICDPSLFTNACKTLALQLGWGSVNLRDQLLYSPNFFPLLNANMEEHQDLYGVFPKLFSVLFYFCLDWTIGVFCCFSCFMWSGFSNSLPLF